MTTVLLSTHCDVTNNRATLPCHTLEVEYSNYTTFSGARIASVVQVGPGRRLVSRRNPGWNHEPKKRKFQQICWLGQHFSWTVTSLFAARKCGRYSGFISLTLRKMLLR